jgi:S-methylmethionine transporter
VEPTTDVKLDAQPARPPAADSGLRRSMGPRHLVMIAMGGVIGSGLFLSSGYTISQAGPLGAVIAYLIGAFVVYLVMACLGELAILYPVSGAFHIYAARSIGPATGFATAWLYWLCWAVAIGSEFTASGLLMQRWFPDVEVWVWCLVFAAVLFGFNAVSSKFFGESEFWFAIVKVAAIIGLIVLGGAALFGFRPLGGGGEHPFLFENFATEGGLFPNGFTGVRSPYSRSSTPSPARNLSAWPPVKPRTRPPASPRPCAPRCSAC